MIEHKNLTLRELEVVEELLNNPNIVQVANKLCIARSTLTTHLRWVYKKLNIHSLAELVKYFYQKELNRLYKENQYYRKQFLIKEEI